MNLLELFKFFEEFRFDDYFSGKNSKLDRQKNSFIDFIISRSSSNESLSNSINFYIDNKTGSRYVDIADLLKIVLEELSEGSKPAEVLWKHGFISNHEKVGYIYIKVQNAPLFLNMA